MNTIEHYEKMIVEGIRPISLPMFIKDGRNNSFCGGEFIWQAIAMMQRDAAKITRDALSKVKASEEEFWHEVKNEDECYRASYLSKLRLTFLHTSLFEDSPSPVWSETAFRTFLREHLTHKHSLQEIEQSERVIDKLLRREAERQLQECVKPTCVDQEDKPLPYDDLQSAMKHFREREREMEKLIIDEDDKEMIRIRLAEKRSLVLDEFI